MRAADLELDLDVFAGPFDLLMAVVLREEVDLLEVDLGEVVIAYLARLEAVGDLDLESATEFLVLIASLLELKSRLMLPGEEVELSELGPEEAAEELLARMLEYKRYAGAAEHLHERYEAARGFLYRSAPLPAEYRRASLDAATQAYEPAQLAVAVGDLLYVPPPLPTRHFRPTVSLELRLEALRGLLAGEGRLDFDEAFSKEDRLTQAVTIFALLDMYKRGEATWKQSETFGSIEVTAV